MIPHPLATPIQIDTIMSEHVRVEVIYRGQVQGVGFRATACNFASDIPVTGTVRNLMDGAVELIIEGQSDDISALLNKIADYWGTRISTADRCRGRALGEFSDFRIVR